MNISMRIRFSRGDVAKFISHLDTVKVFERAARRANLPVAYSQGFNPHPRIVFGLPAAVGTASRGEYADFELAAEMEPAMFMDKLNEHLPDSIRVMTAAVKKTGQNIMASVAAAEYTLEIYSAAGIMIAEEDISEKLKMLLKKDCIKISRESRNKDGTTSAEETDIRPMILEARLEQSAGMFLDGESSGECKSAFIIRAILRAGSKANLRPELFVKALEEHAGIPVSSCRTTRENLYVEKDGKLVDPMDRAVLL